MFGTWTCSYADNLSTVLRRIVARSTRAGRRSSRRRSAGTCATTTLYGFPQEFNIEYGATLVNTGMAEAAGVDSTAGWASWDEFKADAKAMTETTDDAITRAGYHFTAERRTVVLVLLAASCRRAGSILADDGTSFTIDTPEAREAIALMKSIVDEGIIDPDAVQRHGELGRRLLLRGGSARWG